MAIADFDLDGRPTWWQPTAVRSPTTPTPGTIAVLRQNEDGSFGPARTFGRGCEPGAVVVADLNGDGRMDAATANLESDNVSVLLGNGDGSLSPAQNYQVGRAESTGRQRLQRRRKPGHRDGQPAFIRLGLCSAMATARSKCRATSGRARNPFPSPSGISTATPAPTWPWSRFLPGSSPFCSTTAQQPSDGVTVVRDVDLYRRASPPTRSDKVWTCTCRRTRPISRSCFSFTGGSSAMATRPDWLIWHAPWPARGWEWWRSTTGSPTAPISRSSTRDTCEDVAQAFAWTYRHIAEYGGDLGQIVLMGHSAGGSLVSMLATDRRYLAAQGLSPDVVRGVIGVSAGLYDQRSALQGSERTIRGRVRYPRAALGGIPASLTWTGLSLPSWSSMGSSISPRSPRTARLSTRPSLPPGRRAELHMIPDRDHAGIIGRSARDGDPARDYILRFIALHTNWDLARVKSVQVNDGSAQRSMVNSLTVTFDRPVTIDAGAFELRRQRRDSGRSERRERPS